MNPGSQCHAPRECQVGMKKRTICLTLLLAAGIFIYPLNTAHSQAPLKVQQPGSQIKTHEVQSLHSPDVPVEGLEKEIISLNQEIQQNPKDGKLFLNRGLAYARFGQMKQAVWDFSRAIELKKRGKGERKMGFVKEYMDLQ